ncbi:DUF4166 domain-containing protein [Shimia sp.]|uniref:DUF4166 domain-containing protein n=1 Tax=Shimia sp. TaxID=1954381 RepID=UPI003B8B3257
MKVAVLGGYGVFGGRLADLLVRDGHQVVVVGRSFAKAEALAGQLGCAALEWDIHSDPAPLVALSPDVVIDAVGPFQTYVEDPYRVARLSLQMGADYLDLSDSAAFTSGISILDAEAKRVGRRVLSGVSSVPGLSSAVVADLVLGLDDVLLIESAILPGNRAPRGASVMASIMGQLGRETQVWRGGKWRALRGWRAARRVTLAPGLERVGRFVEVPDIRLFPEAFKARSVMFRAGMELGFLNFGMRMVAAVRQVVPFEITPRRVAVFRWLAQLTERFGTDRGGMHVEVIGRQGEQVRRHSWTLVAEAGEGPYIPAVAARVLMRHFEEVPPGARPCVRDVSLDQMQAGWADLEVTTQRQDGFWQPQFEIAFGEKWNDLPNKIKELHCVADLEVFTGEARVTRDGGLLAQWVARLFGFPKATERCAVRVTKTRTDKDEIWERDFAGQRFLSRCRLAPEPGRFRERFGPFQFEMDLTVMDGVVGMPVRKGWFLGLRMPRWLLPISETREFVADGCFHFDVSLAAPLGVGAIVRYQGWLEPEQ